MADQADQAQVFRLIYRSRDRIDPARRNSDLGELFTGARSNNKRLNVTGALLISEQFFVQTLEGEQEVVRTLFARIEKDPRHDAVTIIKAGTTDERVFPRWAMARVDDASARTETYLIAHENGIAPASDRGTTPAQRTVLGAMRDAMYGASTRL